MSGFAQKRSFCKRRGENKGAKRLVLQKQLEAAIARHARALQMMCFSVTVVTPKKVTTNFSQIKKAQQLSFIIAYILSCVL